MIFNSFGLTFIYRMPYFFPTCPVPIGTGMDYKYCKSLRTTGDCHSILNDLLAGLGAKGFPDPPPPANFLHLPEILMAEGLLCHPWSRSSPEHLSCGSHSTHPPALWLFRTCKTSLHFMFTFSCIQFKTAGHGQLQHFQCLQEPRQVPSFASCQHWAQVQQLLKP